MQLLRPYAQPPQALGTHEVQEGRFEIGDLQNGVYRLVATTEDGRIALSRDVDLLSEERAPDVELVLSPGAEVTVHVRGAQEDSIVAIARGTRIFAVATLPPGETFRQNVPGGRLSVSVLSPEGVVLDQLRLTGIPGESHDVVFDVR